MPGKQQFGIDSAQRVPFCGQQVQRQSRIQLRIIDLTAHQSTVPVVLYQVVIGIGGESEWTEPQGIHGWHAQHPESGCRRPQVFEIKMDQIVADKAVALRCKLIELLQCGGQSGGAQTFFPKRQCCAGLLIDGGQRIYSLAPFSNFQIDRNTAHRQLGSPQCATSYNSVR